MANKSTYKIKINATGEIITAFKLYRGGWADYDNMSAELPPQAAKAGKKEFQDDEVTVIEEIKN